MSGFVLVTGANGRLGRAVVERLGDQAIAGVRKPAGFSRELLIPSDGNVAPNELVGITAVINCAGRVDAAPDDLAQANVTYPATLARAAREAGTERFVQVSSFSVFGRIERIDASSEIAPVDDYGHSKVDAEQVLARLETRHFHTTAVRLPFMFSATHPALFGRLIPILLRLRFLPSTAGAPASRSMITYAEAAGALIACASGACPSMGTIAAADPEPLALSDLAAAIQRHLGKKVTVAPIPATIAKLMTNVAPSIGNRLFRSSVLAPEANFLQAPVRHRVSDELERYLANLAQLRQDRQSSKT